MNELTYYKLSGKINLKTYILGFILAIIASYFIGEFYLYLSNKFYSFFIEVDSFNNQLEQISTRVQGRILLIVMCILTIPTLIALILMACVMLALRQIGKSRNKIIDFISFVILSSICFFVSNEYEITTIVNYIEFFIFCLLALLFSLWSTYYFCEECSKKYKETIFYLISDLNNDVFLDNVIKNGLEIENRYTEKQILENEDIENLYHVELNKCDTCGSQIVKIASNIIDWENGKKKIEYSKTITEHLIIN